MKSNFLKFLFLFCFFSLVTADSQTENKAILVNINGLPIYKSKDINRKIGVLEKGEEFLIISKHSDENWVRIETKKGNGFILNSNFLSSDILTFTNPLEKRYLVLKHEKNFLLEKPFFDARVLENLNQFSIVEILALGSSIENIKGYGEDRWYEVKTKDNKNGFVKDIAISYESLEQAKSVAEKKQLQLSGYALVSAPIYLKEPGGEVINEKNMKNGFSKKDEFINVIESQEKNGIKYYFTSMSNPSRKMKMQITPEHFNESPFDAWISEQNVKYFTPKEFTLYTLKNSKFNEDKSLLEKTFAQNEDIPSLNFLNAYQNLLTSKKKKENTYYGLVNLFIGYVNSSGFGELEPVMFLYKKDKENFTVFAGKISDRGKIKIFDLDKDGIPEIFSSMDNESMSRVAFTTPAFYGYINGAYKVIPLPGDFLDRYEIDENFLYLDEKDYKNKKISKKKYKYKNGLFKEVKN
jgi:hypothetical protein